MKVQMDHNCKVTRHRSFSLRLTLLPLSTVTVDYLDQQYSILGLEPSATDDQVKSAFKKMAMKLCAHLALCSPQISFSDLVCNNGEYTFLY